MNDIIGMVNFRSLFGSESEIHEFRVESLVGPERGEDGFQNQ